MATAIAFFTLPNRGDAKVNSLRLENLSVEDGLSQASVNYVFQDSEGFVWVSTESGVQTYDGYNFKEIAGPDGDFSSFSAFKIDQSQDGLIWLDIYGKGLYTFDKQTQSYELMLKTEENNSIAHFYLDDKQKVWIATLDSIGHLDRNTKSFIEEVDLFPQLGPKKNIYHITESRGVVYIGTGNGIYAYQASNGQLVKLPAVNAQNASSDNFNSREASKIYGLTVIEQTLFFGTNDGVFSLDISHIQQFFTSQIALPKYQLIIPHLAVWQFYQHDDLLLVGANEGLYEINLNTQNSKFVLTYDLYDLSIAVIHVQTLMVDKNGTYWMGSVADGLFLWNPKSEKVQNYGYTKGSDSSLSTNQVTAILPHKTEKDRLWVGTTNGLNLIQLDTHQIDKIFLSADTDIGFNENNINDIFNGMNAQLWLSTAAGLKLYDTKSKKIIPLPFNDETNQILAEQSYLAHVENEYLWFSTSTDLIRIDLKTQKLETFGQLLDELANREIWNLLGHIADDPDEFWFSTNLALWKFNLKTNALSKVYQHPEISDGKWSSIDSVVIDESAGLAWIAFSLQGLIGVSLESQETKYYFEQNNSKLDNKVYGVNQDADSDIWVSTHKGIFVLDTQTLHIRRFGLANGLIGDEFNANAYSTLVDGQFAYGAMNGVSIFDPVQLKNSKQSTPLDIVVSNVSLLSRDISLPFSLASNAEISLEYDDVGIRIDFTTFSFASSKDVRFEYNLNNQGFISLKDNYIVFPTLSPGKNQLTLKAKSTISGEYSKPISIFFNVSHAPWRSPVAFFIYMLVAFLLMAFWFRKSAKQRAELLAAHDQVIFRENRLQLALKGSNSDVWDWHLSNNKFTANRFKNLTCSKSHWGELSFTDFISQIHADDSPTFVAKWQRFIDSADISATFNCTFRLKDQNDQWLWYKDLGKIVELNAENRPTRVTGSYTNITKSKVDEERAQYFGEAFRQTKDWVIIINQDFTKVTSNAAIRKVFGWEQEEFPFHASLLGFDNRKIKFYSDIILNLKGEQHWRGEDLITTKDGTEFHVIINISVGTSSNGNLHYIFVFTDITALKIAENELRYVANYDHLTGLPNRALLFERIDQAINRAARKKENIALFFIDLDRFKKINDTLGHDFGDILLVNITQRLTKVLRQDDTIARQGGDEFVILLERFSSPTKLTKIAQKIINSVEKPVQLKETVVSVGCSIGIAMYPDDGESAAELLRNSDIAMYCAKQNGRNGFQFFEASMNDASAKRLVQEAKIKLAVKSGQFVNHYQPIVDAHIGKAVGVEMLMRWPTEHGLVPPDEFIPLAEDLNLIIPMTEVALTSALLDLTKWRQYRADFYISINISASHFIKGNLVQVITNALNKHNIPTNAIKLEITESAFIFQPEIAIEQMTQLKKLGIELALDDFGTGYSSLSYLKSLPIDVIKIDRSFISSIGQQHADEAIIQTIISLAKNLDMKCIAEGVESKEQIEFLVALNCHFIQGFFYSKALTCADVLSMLEKNTDAYSTKV